MKKGFIIVIILCACIARSLAQECPGGLGDNLFTAGDFGSGSSFVVLDDPMIAPGYSYTLDGPPNDGSYMITNDMNKWLFVYGTWLVIGDNSPDPDGYMMVVNASFEPGLFYQEVVDGLCDNTDYEFSADIINLIRRGVTDHSDPNVVFLLDDEAVLNTGDILKTEQWRTYSFSFSTAPGQTSVKLSLRNNAPGGTGNDLALDNISFRACGPKSEISLVNGADIVCEEELPLNLIATLDGMEQVDRTYLWEVSRDDVERWTPIVNEGNSSISFEPDGPGQLSFRFATAASTASFANEKCRFYSDIFSLQVTERDFEVFDTICGGSALDFGNATLIEPGTYVQELTSKYGCDSIVTIYLDTVRREVLSGNLELEDPFCFGEETGVIRAVDVLGGYPPYHLDINGEDTNGLLAERMSAGNYNVMIEDRFDCFSSFNIDLFDPERLNLDLGPDLAMTLGEDADISLESNQSLSDIKWAGIGNEFDGQSSFSFLPIENLELSVQGVSDVGCVGSDSLKIILETEVSIYIPNIFSPNDDRVNDEYYISPFGKSLGSIEYFIIFDRWGGIVWESAEDSTSWDGRDPSGQSINPGIYSFVMEGKLINGDPVKESGTITIVN